LKLLDSFKGMAMVNIPDGKSCYFWLDLWSHNVLQLVYPELCSFAKDIYISVDKVQGTTTLHTLFHLPLSAEAYAQFQEVQLLIQNITVQRHNDQWSYSWGSSIFSLSKAYKVLIGHTPVHYVYRWLWKSSCQNKRKSFWLVLKDRLSTRNVLQRRNIFFLDYSCVHCMNTTEETLFHLLVGCPFAVDF